MYVYFMLLQVLIIYTVVVVFIWGMYVGIIIIIRCWLGLFYLVIVCISIASTSMPMYKSTSDYYHNSYCDNYE